MMRLCAWCKKDMDTGRQLTDEEYNACEETATHGICPKCEAEYFPEPVKNVDKQLQKER